MFLSCLKFAIAAFEEVEMESSWHFLGVVSFILVVVVPERNRRMAARP